MTTSVAHLKQARMAVREAVAEVDKKMAAAAIAQVNGMTLADFQIAWLKQVHRDQRLTRSAFFLSFQICSKYLLNASEFIEVPQSDFADEMQVSHDTIQRILRSLERFGHMRTEWRRGRGACKWYWLVLKDRDS